ncbi:MAG: antibiotic biosynthesis monooxygenase [Firmicutes bacterium]|nr:antibiotic biosynthesis monooxygenase [Bacillota bacterium]MBR5926532.1 antibiotic biosynthesis monooxygenase [Bacillota bacterium]MBR6025312.1 antibiotic biosynthesis monooxygenase [Bacillota bacterium]
MIYLLVTYHFLSKEDRDAFYEKVKDILPEFHKEEGNFLYEYFFPADHENEILLLEKWENQKALDAHGSSDASRFIGKIKGEFEVKTDVEKIIAK